MNSDVVKKSNQGLRVCTLDNILFPVEMIENPQPANTEYQHIVRGYGDFTIVVPEYVTQEFELKAGPNKGKMKEVTSVSYPTKKVNELDLNYCSHRYELVPNEEIFPPVRKILVEKGIKFNETYMHMNYARFYAEYVIDDHSVKVGKGNDVIKPMLKVQHSYNGLTEYQITFGYYRLVCSNGLVIPVQEKSQYNIHLTGKHTQSIRASLKKLSEVIDFFLSQGKKPMRNFELLGGIVVTDLEERAKEVMKAAKVPVVMNTKFNVMTYLQERINKDLVKVYGKDYDELTPVQREVTEWYLYNAINHYLHNNELNVASPKQREDKDKAILNVMLTQAGAF